MVPSRDVFEFTFHLRRHGQKKIYDLGCGIGRNLFFLIDMGFEAHGSDYSLDAVDEVNGRLEELNYPHRVKHESMTEISESDESYDAVIAYNVVYHSYVAEMTKALNHIRRILKNNGSLLITFQSKNSPSYRREEEVESGTVLRRSGYEAGIPHHYVDREDVIQLLSAYRIMDLIYVEHEYDSLKAKGCHYVVTAMKK